MSTAPDSTRSDWQVICLCAEWCGVCREWDPVFEELARRYPAIRFDWVDVEDESDAIGDVDIETFPTMLVAHGGRVRFFGPVQPSPVQVSRLLDQLLGEPGTGADTTPEAGLLLHRLGTSVLRKR